MEHASLEEKVAERQLSRFGNWMQNITSIGVGGLFGYDFFRATKWWQYDGGTTGYAIDFPKVILEALVCGGVIYGTKKCVEWKRKKGITLYDIGFALLFGGAMASMEAMKNIPGSLPYMLTDQTKGKEREECRARTQRKNLHVLRDFILSSHQKQERTREQVLTSGGYPVQYYEILYEDGGKQVYVECQGKRILIHDSVMEENWNRGCSHSCYTPELISIPKVFVLPTKGVVQAQILYGGRKKKPVLSIQRVSDGTALFGTPYEINSCDEQTRSENLCIHENEKGEAVLYTYTGFEEINPEDDETKAYPVRPVGLKIAQDGSKAKILQEEWPQCKEKFQHGWDCKNKVQNIMGIGK